MALQKFLIAPLNSGLQNNADPWLIMDDAYFTLQNMHNWRGAVIKRFGTRVMNSAKGDLEKQLFSRLRVKIGTTDGGGDPNPGDLAAVTVPGTVFKAGQIFSCGDEIYTVEENGAPATMLSTSAAVPVYHTSGGSAGQFSLTGGPVGTDVYWYPAEPVMLLPNYLRAEINDEELFAFDTQFAYQYTNANGWQRLDQEAVAGDSVWTTSANKDSFFWATNYRGIDTFEFILFVTNNVVADAIRYYNGTQWASYSPIYNASNFRIRTCKFILPFKNRLLLFNTTEQTTGGGANERFYNRIRFSQIGDPLQATAGEEAFRDDVAGKGGFLETGIKEAIIGAGYVKDRLIVECERSTWEVVSTNNKRRPFRLQRLNSNLGVESMHSIVPFDKEIVGFGPNGIHTCNGMNVSRIDNAIPDEIFQVSNDEAGPQRVFGARNYWTEEVYWSYTSTDRTNPSNVRWPNQVLVYNYKTKTWAKNTDSITAFGYYYNETALTWADVSETWEESDDRWNEPSLQARFRSTVAGNQEGWTSIIDNEKNSNTYSLSIHKIEENGEFIALSILDHNLNVDEFIKIDNVQGDDGDALNGNAYQIEEVIDKDTITINEPDADGSYDGGGTITYRPEPVVTSKRYNFFSSIGMRLRVPRIDFLVSKTVNGELSYEVYSSFNDIDLVDDVSVHPGVLYGRNIIETKALTTYEESQDKIWRSVFPSLEGDTIQYTLKLNFEQMLDNSIAESDLEIHAVLFHAEASGDFGG